MPHFQRFFSVPEKSQVLEKMFCSKKMSLFEVNRMTLIFSSISPVAETFSFFGGNFKIWKHDSGSLFNGQSANFLNVGWSAESRADQQITQIRRRLRTPNFSKVLSSVNNIHILKTVEILSHLCPLRAFNKNYIYLLALGQSAADQA